MSQRYLLTYDLSFQIQDDGVTLQYNPYSWNKVNDSVFNLNGHSVM